MSVRFVATLAVSLVVAGCSAPEPGQETGNNSSPAPTATGGSEQEGRTNNARGETNTSQFEGTSGGEYCEAYRFGTHPGEGFLVCNGSEGDYRCGCDDDWSRSDAATCEGALRDSCAATDAEVASCQDFDSRCWADDDGSFRCLCGEPSDFVVTDYDPSEWVESDAATCREALWSACALPCNGPDRCVPTSDPEPGSYSCECVYYGQTRTVYVGNRRCRQAAASACDPERSGWAGWCEQTTTPERGFECTCLDGTTDFIAGADLTVDEDGGEALERLCGVVAPLDEYSCWLKPELHGVNGHCVQGIDDDGQPFYRCACGVWEPEGTSSPEQLESWAGTVATGDCQEAVQTVCDR